MMLFRGMMKRFGPAVTISIVIHGTLAVALGFYLAYTQIEAVHQVVASFIEPLKQRDTVTKPREVSIKPEVLPQIPQAPIFATAPIVAASTTGTAGGGGVGGASRTVGTSKGIGGAVGIGKFAVESGLEVGYSGRYRGGVSTQMVNVPGKILGAAKVSPGVVADPTVTSPGELTYTGPSGRGTGVGTGTGFGAGAGSGFSSSSSVGLGRGLVGVQAKVARGVETKLPGMSGISVAESVNAAEASTVLNTMSKAVTIGADEVPALSKGEPGGIIIGKGKDLKGRIHLVKLDDPLDLSADTWGSGIGGVRFGAGLPYLVKVLNEKTGIKASLEGAITLTDPGLFKAPIVFMEPALASATGSKSRSARAHGGGVWKGQGIRNKYTEPEIAALRKYIVEKGGFLYILTHGNFETVLMQARKLLQDILPEHTLQRIPKEHPIYSCYYELGGPLRFPFRALGGACDIGAPIATNTSGSGGSIALILGEYSELQGIMVQGRLAVLVDTEAAMHVLDMATQKPFYGVYASMNDVMVSMSPYAARELTNVVVYAMTHGGISNYQNYVPELKSDDEVKVNYTAPAIPSAKF